jgi:putative transposase
MAGGRQQASRGPGSPGREPGAKRSKRSGRKRTENNVKRNKVEDKKKRNKNDENSSENEIEIVPLNAWACLLLEAVHDPRASGGSGAQAVRVWRCDTLRLLPTPQQEELLRLVGDQCARLVNMENFRRRRLFFSAGRIDDSWRSTWDMRKTEYADIYRLLGSANFHEVCRLIAEQWRSFKELLRKKKQGELPSWMEPKPPGYRKRDGERLPIIIIRFDNYRIDLEKRVIHLRYWGIEVPFKGKPRWLTRSAKQGRLIITYDPAKKRWYAKIAVEVTLERKNAGCNYMGIDLGREVLLTAATSSGEALLYKGSALKSDYFYFERRIAEVDRMLAKLEEVDRSVLLEERRRLYGKRKRRRDQIFANAAAHLARLARELGIGIVLIGYPWNISQEKGNKGNTNMWGYRRLAMRLAITLENADIPAFLINEDNTSRKCAYHHVDAVRNPRGLITCPLGHTLHSDVNAALNILLRGLEALGIKTELPRQVRVLSFLPTPGGVVERKRN